MINTLVRHNTKAPYAISDLSLKFYGGELTPLTRLSRAPVGNMPCALTPQARLRYVAARYDDRTSCNSLM